MKTIRGKWLPLVAFLNLSLQSPVPVEKEPQHQVKFENQYVRVLDVTFPPGYTTLFHTHSNDNVAIVIKGGKRRTERVGEQPNDGISQTGNANFAKASYTHRITNTGETTLRFIDVEILASSGLPEMPRSLDKVNGQQLILENERVRIYRIKIEPGQATKLFTYDLPSLTVVVSPSKVQIETPKQKTRTESLKPGDFRWHAGAFSHLLRNLGSTSFEAIDIELK